ncbi:MAG: aminodeoxychorismate synthase component I [Afipia sp.]|nr:aminodeoxychorismate synthase component I [Afipia sp.]OJW66016.1 MAG: aminodeoxychorismate synthase, component I [Afipia sp. 64-13]
MKTLVIDNYDSFTHNLVHLIGQINQEEPLVVFNDEMTWDELSARRFDNIVISPGPGRPDRAADFGLCRDAIKRANVPLLGVCLGHQGIAMAAGAELINAPSLVHGRSSLIMHKGHPLFAGMASPFAAARYHSFIVGRPLPDDLEEIAWTEDGLVMALARRSRSQWGVQFHPESILTEDGHVLLQNFRDLSRKARGTTFSSVSSQAPARAQTPVSETRKAFWRELPRAIDAEAAFCTLYKDSPHAFWLDSSMVDPALSRWSYLGDASGPQAAVLQYQCRSRSLTIADARDTRVEKISLFDFLEREKPFRPQSAPPCPFTGGKIGWFGYELRNDCGSPAARQAATPDALLIDADRFIAIDHLAGKTYLCAIDDADEVERAEHWLAATQARLENLALLPAASAALPSAPLTFRLDRGRQQYLADVRRCLDLIGQGESYQVCLTNELSCFAELDPLTVYRTLRRINPAPYAAFLQWPGGAVLSASPERFLAVGADGHVETKPIKGTIRRDPDAACDRVLVDHLRQSRKDRAENAMIVDLLRNDLSRSCVPGSVTVPKLWDVETYRTVHQMVSTVRGTLKAGRSVAGLLRDTFPGGSMTGAPKHRTMEIIDELERRPRGIYSGALGWIGLDGAADLSIVIRAIVAVDKTFTIGVGGGVVADSTPQGEYDEMLLKAQASIRAIVTALFGEFDDAHYRIDEGEGMTRGEVEERQHV